MSSEQQDIRPDSFDSFIGQKQTIDVLKRVVTAAKHNGRACGHVLIAGNAGTGKTSIASLISVEMMSKLHVVMAPAIQHKGELTAALTGLGRNDVLFIDEIHALKPAMQEMLYSSMEDGFVDLAAGKRQIRIQLQAFTLAGATTHPHLLTGPMRDRFAYSFQLTTYTVPELAMIAHRTMGKLGIASAGPFCADHADAVARRSRGVPRIANRLVRSLRDFMQSAGEHALTLDIIDYTFDTLGIDSLGLTSNDRRYLEIVCARLGSPVGVLTLAAQLGLERGEIERMIEPWLMECGFVARTPQGRIGLPDAVAHLQRYAERQRTNQHESAELQRKETTS